MIFQIPHCLSVPGIWNLYKVNQVCPGTEFIVIVIARSEERATWRSHEKSQGSLPFGLGAAVGMTKGGTTQ